MPLGLSSLGRQPTFAIEGGPVRGGGVVLGEGAHVVVVVQTEAGRAVPVKGSQAAAEPIVEVRRPRPRLQVLQGQEARARALRLGARQHRGDAQCLGLGEPMQATGLHGKHVAGRVWVHLDEHAAAVVQVHPEGIVDVTPGKRARRDHSGLERPSHGVTACFVHAVPPGSQIVGFA